jgi:predicted HTH domain antitoxin
MMGEAVTAFVDNNTFNEIEMLSKEFHTDRTEIVKELIREGLKLKLKKRALELYANRKVTLQKAAEMMGVSIWEMLDVLRREEIHLDYGLEELEEDLEPILKLKL